MSEKTHTILIVDDESEIRTMLSTLLDSHGFKIEQAESGKQAIRKIASVKPSLTLLDLNLPDINGKDIVSTVRKWSQLPILLMSACGESNEIAEGLNIGADDYLTKPFNIDVLIARINMNLRKSVAGNIEEFEISNGPVRIDLVRRKVYVDGKKVFFTPREYDLLRYLLINRGKMLTHKHILKLAWGLSGDEDTPYLRVYINRIRKKIEKDRKNPRFIINEPRVGYYMENYKALPAEEPQLSKVG